ncbi:MAG: DNA replication/repair protein RecF [Chlamydiae bacterium]|nr:DNA replication/repair protein RecF [Chlamydiota bacterium]
MFLESLILRNFRNHSDLELSFSPTINLIVGDNGVGKTSLLEAIHLISTGRSFRTSQLQELIGIGHSHFYLEAHFIKDDISQTLKIGYNGQSKKIEHNSTYLPSFSNLLGILPSVLYAPKDIALIMGSPDDRRRFLNLYLSQKDPLYVYHLLRYTKALKHRNFLLKKGPQTDPLEIECFEKEMANSSVYLMQQRQHALSTFELKISSIAPTLTKNQEKFTMHYEPSLSMQNPFSKESLAEAYKKYRKKELLLKTSLVGPHRDDFTISLNHQLAKSFCSEGQKRSFLSALKIAEWSLLLENHKKNPLMCIDDIGVHLDPSRLHLLEEAIHSLGQVFLTSPKEPPHLKAKLNAKTITL